MVLSLDTLYTAPAAIRIRLAVDSAGNVYFGSGNYLYGVDSNGNDLSGFPVDLGQQTQDIEILNDYVYVVITTVVSNNGKVRKYNTSGVLQWSTSLGLDIHRIYLSDRAYISTDIWGEGWDVFIGLNLTTGAVEKAYNICYNSQPRARQIVIGDYIYAFTAVGGGGSECAYQIRRYNKETAAYINQYTTTNDIHSGSTKDSSDNIYFGNSEGRFYKISSDLGTVLSYLTGGAIVSTPLIDGTKVYFGSNDNKIYCLNTNDLSLAWSYLTGGDVTAKPAVVDSNLYIGSADAVLYKLDLDGNFVDSSAVLAGAISQDLYYINNKLYVPAGDTLYYIRSTFTISGYVKSRSGIPFSGVLVTIGGNEDTTDDFGYYSIAGVSLGSNDITVERSLRKTHSETRNITADETINFTLYEIKSGKIFKSTGSSLEGGIACGTGRREKK